MSTIAAIVLRSPLRCVSILADKITQTTALEDRRIRKDLQVFPSSCWWKLADFLGRIRMGSFSILLWYPSVGTQTPIIGPVDTRTVWSHQAVGAPQCLRVSLMTHR